MTENKLVYESRSGERNVAMHEPSEGGIQNYEDGRPTSTTSANPIAIAEPVPNAEYIPMASARPVVNENENKGEPTKNDDATTSTESTGDEENGQPTSQSKDLKAPSGILGAVVGMMFGGPILAALVGFGCAYGVRKEGAGGDFCRSVGEMGLSIQEKTTQFEEKHHVCAKAQRTIDEYTVTSKVKSMFVSWWKSAVELDRKHQILEKGVEKTGQGIEYVAEKIGSFQGNNRTDGYTSAPQNPLSSESD